MSAQPSAREKRLRDYLAAVCPGDPITGARMPDGEHRYGALTGRCDFCGRRRP
jgi:hypothetical protein